MIGKTFSGYIVVSKLGAGGMGEVFLAEDTKLRRKVALKVLGESVGQDPAFLERFTREAETLASLNHPNIVTIFNIEEVGPQRVLIMELIQGQNLSDVISAEGRLSFERTIDLALQLTDASMPLIKGASSIET